MDFFGIGPWEIVLILILALIILGPGKLTETAKTLGKIVRSIRKTSAEFTAAVTREMNKVEEDEPPKPDTKEKEAALPPAGETQPAPEAKKTTPTEPERHPQ
jgi:Sec-independent protein translocase protein TatA